MKAYICFIMMTMLAWQGIGYGQNKVQSETTFDNHGIPTQRLHFVNEGYSLKYDYKVDVSDAHKTVNDVMSFTAAPISLGKGFTLTPCFIKLGDLERSDEYFADLTLSKAGKDLSYFIEIGRGMSAVNAPRDYFFGRLSHEDFTLEGGLLAKKGYKNFSEFATEKYLWGAYHPKGIFIAIGNQVNTTWLLGGTTGLKHFGNFTFMSSDRENRNRWFRSQFGFVNINQNYFCNDNYKVGTSYLVVIPFHYMRFGPISTKGDWGFKIDGIQTADNERYEFIGSRKFGKFGNFAIGYQRDILNSNGLTFEYYQDLSLDNFRLAIELKYEANQHRTSGFLTLVQTL